jgi:hypothetical protein
MAVTVVKVGGSLIEDPRGLARLCLELEGLARVHKILAVPGGSIFADVVRDIDQTFHLSNVTAHRMAILAMDQFGLLLSDIARRARSVQTLTLARHHMIRGNLPILLPSRLLLRSDRVRPSWDVTSDSITAYVAELLRARRLILATDVDGIFTADPKVNRKAKLLKQVSISQLLRWNRRTSVDRFLPRMLGSGVECYIVNGKYPERVASILEGNMATYTRVTS